jgi:hypothetical protein
MFGNRICPNQKIAGKRALRLVSLFLAETARDYVARTGSGRLLMR